MKKRFSSALILLLVLTLFSACGKSSETIIDEDFIGRHDMLMQMYMSESIEAAEASMVRLEERLILIDGNPKLYGVKTKKDFLAETRLRLWGIYSHLGEKEKTENYKVKLKDFLADAGQNIESLNLTSLLDSLDSPFAPAWTGASEEKALFPEGITIQEALDSGYIERSNQSGHNTGQSDPAPTGQIEDTGQP